MPGFFGFYVFDIVVPDPFPATEQHINIDVITGERPDTADKRQLLLTIKEKRGIGDGLATAQDMPVSHKHLVERTGFGEFLQVFPGKRTSDPGLNVRTKKSYPELPGLPGFVLDINQGNIPQRVPEIQWI